MNDGKLPGRHSSMICLNTSTDVNIKWSMWWVLSLKPSNWFFSAGDEAQVNLVVVQASYKDSGVYRCTITNEYGTDSTDCLLSGESTCVFTSNFSLKTDLLNGSNGSFILSSFSLHQS